MPLIALRLQPADAARLRARLGSRATAGRYVAQLLREHLAGLLQQEVLRYQPLCRAVARKVWAAHVRRALPGTAESGGAGVVDLEEVEAEVLAALAERAQHWDPSRGITLGAYAELWLVAAARKAIQRTWRRGELPEPEEAAAPAEVGDLAGLPRRLRRAAAALVGASAAPVSPAELHELAERLGGTVRLVSLRELAEKTGQRLRRLQALAQAGEISAVRCTDGCWYVPTRADRG